MKFLFTLYKMKKKSNIPKIKKIIAIEELEFEEGDALKEPLSVYHQLHLCISNNASL